MSYIYHIVIISLIYSILSVSLNIIVGYTGLLSIGHATFYGIGAYTSAILCAKYGFPFWAGLIAGAALAAMLGAILGFPILRVRGDYLIIATLGFCEIVRALMLNWDSLTEGPRGITGVPPAKFLWLYFGTDTGFLGLVSFFFIFTIIIALFIKHSPFGRILSGIRQDEFAVSCLGKNVAYYKIVSLGIGSFFAGIAGSLYAHFISFIDPSTFTVTESILIFCMVVLGGFGSVTGSIISAILLTALPEALRFVELSGTFMPNVREIIYGIILIALMLYKPNGLMGKYSIS